MMWVGVVLRFFGSDIRSANGSFFSLLREFPQLIDEPRLRLQASERPPSPLYRRRNSLMWANYLLQQSRYPREAKQSVVDEEMAPPPLQTKACHIATTTVTCQFRPPSRAKSPTPRQPSIKGVRRRSPHGQAGHREQTVTDPASNQWR
jgi:hypothetical protein